MSWRRAAMNRYISASASMSSPAYRTTSRIRSPSSVPPGSRMTTGSCGDSHSPTISTWVVLPEPSVPSKVMNRPRLMPGELCGFFGGRSDAQTALGFLACTARGELILRDELMLESSQVRVLGRDLDRAQGGLHRLDGRRGLGQRPCRAFVMAVDAVDAG